MARKDAYELPGCQDVAVLDGGLTSGETRTRVLVPRLRPGRQEGMR